MDAVGPEIWDRTEKKLSAVQTPQGNLGRLSMWG